MSSTKVCCGCDIFALTKGFTSFEIGIYFFALFHSIANLFSNSEISEFTLGECMLSVAWIVYLFLELHGLQKRKNGIIVLGCIIRCLLTLTVLILMFVISFGVVRYAGVVDKMLEALLDGDPNVAILVKELNWSHSDIVKLVR